MKKLILCIMFFLGTFAFSEKLNTDGRDNLEKLAGKWANGQFEIVNKNKSWFFAYYCGDCDLKTGMELKCIEKYKNGVFVVKSFYEIPSKKDKNFYFAWDIKYKIMVELDKDLNIINKYPRKITGPAG